ncbi:CYSTEINE-RICH RECEPTOR-LIKE KINASE [Salix koriyanagi]|uniref:CYSTEINE-RICH RECEPTOR-LIKE KINASE n=1 Tax=Salix koriyanagi TaxID=2511006 RepID=A0A9Q0UEX4_9ROSI|nr:CYSTEINE-RICH RECEPTOR-LIKE KINASE [Salix koriyanagi]
MLNPRLGNYGTKEIKRVDRSNVCPDSCNAEEFSRYMHIGLLCVQEDASDRPTMSSVVLMLKSHNSFLPQPERPAFVGRFMDNPEATANNFSVNEMTLSDVDPR